MRAGTRSRDELGPRGRLGPSPAGSRPGGLRPAGFAKSVAIVTTVARARVATPGPSPSGRLGRVSGLGHPLPDRGQASWPPPRAHVATQFGDLTRLYVSLKLGSGFPSGLMRPVISTD